MRTPLTSIRERLEFFSTAMRDFDKNASLFPSSRFLVEAMLKPLPLDRLTCITEFGPGTGVMTRGLLKRMRPDAHLHCIELDEKLTATLREHVQDPRLKLVCGDAIELRRHLDACGCKQTQGVVSSLGLSLIPGPIRHQILQGTVANLDAGGWFTQYSYVYTRWINWSPQTKQWSTFYARSLLEQYFAEVESEVVPLNLPPAVAYACRKPLVG
jgi:phospholipid N-methyltransferase